MGKVRWSTGVCSLPQDLHSINTATTPLFWDRIQVGTGTVRVRYGTLRYGTVAGEPCRGRIPFLGSRLKLYRGRQSFPSLFSVRASSPEKHFTFHNSQEVSQRTSCCAVYDLHILIDLAEISNYSYTAVVSALHMKIHEYSSPRGYRRV